MENSPVIGVSEAGTKRWPFLFSGTVGSYYGIYIVNVLLSILTLGIYSAWAKVRNKRFFYGHTTLGDHALDFDARPLGILLARIIILALLFALYFLDEYFELYWKEIGLLSTLVVFLLPILTVRGRAFNARHTLYRGVRFNYALLYGPSFRLLFIMIVPLLGFLLLYAQIALDLSKTLEAGEEIALHPLEPVLLALGGILLVLAPFHLYLSHKIKINQLSLGKMQLNLEIGIGSYLRPYCVLMVLFLPFLVLVPLTSINVDSWIVAVVSVSALPYSLCYFLFLGIMTPRYISAVRFAGGSRLHCNLGAGRYILQVELPNYLLLFFSLGLLLPLTRVRKWRALTTATSFIAAPEHTGITTVRENAFREAYDATGIHGDALDFDVDFGVI